MITTQDYFAVLDGRTPYIIQYPDGEIKNNLTIGTSIEIDVLCGSFNPLHNGHKAIYWNMKNLAGRRYTYFEVSIARIGKQGYTLDEMSERLRQFEWYAPVIITNAPTYAEKIKALRIPTTFHVGLDTAERIISQHPLEEIQAWPANFYVYNRGDKTIVDLSVQPTNFHEGWNRGMHLVKDIKSSDIRYATGKFMGEM